MALAKRSRNGLVVTRRSLGIDNKKSVFHSFRHGFKDALRAAGVNEDVNDALTGHSGGNAVARGYGSDDMVRRFGFLRSTPLSRRHSTPVSICRTCDGLRLRNQNIADIEENIRPHDA